MNQQPAFVPMPMMMPGYHAPPPQRIQQLDYPARIHAALEYLQYCMLKQLSRAAVNDISIEVIPGQKLSTAEANAQASAANLLSAYFQGRMAINFWERLEASQLEREAPQGTATTLHCPSCFGSSPKRNCPICRGTGNIIAYPGGSGS